MHRVVLESLIEEETKKKTTQEWLEILEGCGMPYAAINDIQATMNHEHGKLADPIFVAGMLLIR
jgi:succinate--hydroxymethylglutarate CoA-transferase